MNLAYINKLSMQEPATFRAAHPLFLSMPTLSARPHGSFQILVVCVAPIWNSSLLP
jgi:hypothetical protein